MRDLTYAAAYDKCIADEMASKAKIERMGDSAINETAKVHDKSHLWT